MTAPPKPGRRPGNVHFSSGPCAKRPGWSSKVLDNAFLGRSHRAKEGKARLKLAIEKTKAVLGLPGDYLCAIVPGSDTGAFEMAMWTMLGARGVDALAWESFGHGWVNDAVKQLKLADVRVLKAEYGAIPDLAQVDFGRDVLFTANGTTSGVRVPGYDWIAADRQGLTFADATSAAFAQPIDWTKIDVATFSWQKALGGEAAHGMLVLSPRAVARLESYAPAWPLPKVFRLTSGGKLIKGVFEGETINTPSMLCVEDYLDALGWAERLGGVEALIARADANAKVLWDWSDRSGWLKNLAVDPATRSNTSVCLRLAGDVAGRLSGDGQAALVKAIGQRLESEGVAMDIVNHRDAPASLRIWTGATIEQSDLESLVAWLDWAFAVESARLAKAA
jgi:phosphoserine aminotransferase